MKEVAEDLASARPPPRNWAIEAVVDGDEEAASPSDNTPPGLTPRQRTPSNGGSMSTEVRKASATAQPTSPRPAQRDVPLSSSDSSTSALDATVSALEALKQRLTDALDDDSEVEEEEEGNAEMSPAQVAGKTASAPLSLSLAPPAETTTVSTASEVLYSASSALPLAPPSVTDASSSCATSDSASAPTIPLPISHADKPSAAPREQRASAAETEKVATPSPLSASLPTPSASDAPAVLERSLASSRSGVFDSFPAAVATEADLHHETQFLLRSAASNDAEAVVHEVRLLDSHVQDKEKESSSLREQLDAKKQENEALMHQLSQLREQLKAREEFELKARHEVAANFELKERKLSVQISASEKCVEEKSAKINELSTRLADVERKYSEVKEKFIAISQEKSSAELEVAQLRAVIKQKDEQLEQLKQEVKALSDKNSALSEDMKTLDAELKASQLQLTESRMTQIEQGKQIASLQEAVSTVQRKMATHVPRPRPASHVYLILIAQLFVLF